MVLANAAHVGREAQQMGVQIAFLYADIEEEVFVEEQPGFKTQASRSCYVETCNDTPGAG